MSDFQIERMQELFRQLMRGPTKVRRRNTDRLEALLTELAPERLYPYEFICFRITGFRPKNPPAEAHAGRALWPDLLLGLKMLSGSVPRPAHEAGEKVYTDKDISGEFGVSARTVRRWRKRGLPGAVYSFPDGRARLGVRKSALEAFFSTNPALTGRAGGPSRLTRAEERRIAEMARRLASDEGLRLTAAAARIARELGRARETVRTALVRHDRDHPGDAIFGSRAGPLEQEARTRIYSDYRAGTDVQTLCARHARSRASVYRIINQGRAAELLAEEVTFFEEDLFSAADAGAQVLSEEFRAAMQRLEERPESSAPLEGAAPPAHAQPLSREEEAALFRAYNYAKFRVCALRRDVAPSRYVPSRLLDEIEGLRGQAERIRECLIRVHLPVVDQVVKQHARDAAASKELAARGRALLGRLVESYSHHKRGRFSRYAALELMKAFARSAPAHGGKGGTA